ncbi:cbb3-type cytochrome c oxidase N-terminal domain-containing protein [Cyclobacterium jeungdonense]|uniref:Cbb3-type cytochrome c oxidase N-terminal domain-containing protein n=1 Tax=Cyclobacterium jeungdonense TaxID=708087 RepID=A0ABT8C801_9BACT|nr:cbb3-type cytochrome c oxidase N-terminal domain-containing protein [Cyclobacterium jeungdonense]MDN3688655.1 cbb3-type cytochrome c oxidase N-terminal domain-containing protein [Cyclobacterium jeungdonense]
MKTFKLFGASLLSLFLVIPGFAQDSGESWTAQLQQLDSSQAALLLIIAVVLLLIVIIMGLMLYLLSFLMTVIRRDNPALAEKPSWWEEFKVKFVTGKMKPIEQEKDIQLDHSYDGIVELDNFMPPWLKYVFYMSIAFAVIYFVNYSVLGLGQNQYEEYEEELAIAAMEEEARGESMLASIDETSVEFDSSTPAIEAGRELYLGNCAACHAMDGGGGVGPNLTDEYWIHGADIKDVFSVVKYGVIEKGMIPWQDQLSPEQMQQVSSYVLTLQGTTPANPKEPQGEKYEPEVEDPVDALGEDELGLEPVE